MMPQLLDPYANPDTDGVFDDMDPAEEEREDLLGMMYAHVQPPLLDTRPGLAGVVQTKVAHGEAHHPGTWDESKHPRGEHGHFTYGLHEDGYVTPEHITHQPVFHVVYQTTYASSHRDAARHALETARHEAINGLEQATHEAHQAGHELDVQVQAVYHGALAAVHDVALESGLKFNERGEAVPLTARPGSTGGLSDHRDGWHLPAEAALSRADYREPYHDNLVMAASTVKSELNAELEARHARYIKRVLAPAPTDAAERRSWLYEQAQMEALHSEAERRGFIFDEHGKLQRPDETAPQYHEHQDTFSVPADIRQDPEYRGARLSVRGDFTAESRHDLEIAYAQKRAEHALSPEEHQSQQKAGLIDERAWSYATAQEIRDEATRRGLYFDAQGDLHHPDDATNPEAGEPWPGMPKSFPPTRPAKRPRNTPEHERLAMLDWTRALRIRGTPWDGSQAGTDQTYAVSRELDRVNAKEIAQIMQDPGLEHVAVQYFEGWAESSMSHQSQEVQAVVSHLFNLPLRDVSDRPGEPGGPADLFARGQYALTQRELKDMGVEDVTLYRGMGFDEKPQGLEPLPLSERDGKLLWNEAILPSRPLSSWSTSFEMARTFARTNGKHGYVYAMTVPRERIFAATYTGTGAMTELEYIPLGGEDTVGVAYVSGS